MRRPLLLAAAVLVPLAAVAISVIPPGEVVEVENYNVTATTSYINAAQCEDSSAAPPLNLEWSIVRGTLSGAAHYQLYAANEPSSKDDDANYCPTQDDTAGTPNEFASSVGTTVAYTRDLENLKVSGNEAVTAAHKSCTGDGDILYICAHLIDEDTSTPIGHARGKFIVQVTAPIAPVITRATAAGEDSVSVEWSRSTGGVQVDHYRAVAIDGAGAEAGSATTDGTSATISGLTLGTTYTVVVYAYSLGGNPSLASNSLGAAPAEVLNFWEQYKQAGGTDDGGCASGGAGPLALLAVGSLLLLRRRK